MIGSRESSTGIPRSLEIALAGLAMLIFSPVIALCALVIVVSSGTPILFRQQRIGLNGRPFTLIKFRSMHVSNQGPGITAFGDPRVTPAGRFLRRSKLDELPELWNILKGEMSFVGPRPEVPQYVDMADPAWQYVLQVRPGLTDPVTIRLRHEEALLERVKGDREAFYKSVLLPLKLQGYMEYQASRTSLSDLRILVRTAMAIFRADKVAPSVVEELRSQWPQKADQDLSGASRSVLTDEDDGEDARRATL